MYLLYIDGLRALAVLSVMIFHLNAHWLPGGFSGVDVFFVVSGFVVSMSLDKYKDMQLHHFLALFYARRIKRIIPALIFCLILISLLTVLFVPQGNLSSANKDTGFFAFFGLSNYILAKTANDYFSPTTDFNVFAHTWSLGVEEQFYVVFPYLFYIWTLTKRKYYKPLSVATFAILLFVSLGFDIYYSRTNKVLEYYSILSRFWELAFGILLFQMINSGLLARLIAGRKVLLNIGAFVSIGLMFAGFLFSNEKNFPMPWGFLAVSGSLGTLGFVHFHEKGLIHKFLSCQPLSFIGKISYSLYLWHWPIIALFNWTIGLNSVMKYCIAVLLTFMFSIISYFLVEKPIRYSKIISTLPKYIVVTAGIIIVFSFAYTSRAAFRNYQSLTFSTVVNQFEWFPYDYVPNQANGECNLEIKSGNVAGGLMLDINCADHAKRAPAPTVYVVGDSHAGAYGSLIKMFTARTRQRTVMYTLAGCGDTLNQPYSTLPSMCTQFIDRVYTEIENNAKAGDIVVLSSLRVKRLCNQWVLYDEQEAMDSMRSQKAKTDMAQAAEDTKKLLRPILEKGVKIVIEKPKPVFHLPSFRCSDWFNKKNPICARGATIDTTYLLDYRKPIVESIDALASPQNGLYSWDPLPQLCKDTKCSPYDGDKPTFFDGDHISGYGNALIFDSFSAAISDIAKKNEVGFSPASLSKK